VKRIAGLLLAAGASTRMGKPKQLLRLGETTLLDRALGQALNSKLDHIVLVLGFKSEEILRRLQTDRHHPKLRIIENKRFREGISSSIVAGLSAVEKHYDKKVPPLAKEWIMTLHQMDETGWHFRYEPETEGTMDGQWLDWSHFRYAMDTLFNALDFAWLNMHGSC